ncbi:MAG TPA: transcription termination factor Rho [Planctomycetota bacterium]|nr:transcription termination factor Rho [Planctomycetota bacterium]
MNGQGPHAPHAGRRRRRRRRRGGAKLTDPTPVAPVAGILAIAREGHGFLRNPKRDCQIQDADPYVHRDLIQRHGLREGQMIEAHVSRQMRGPAPMVATIDRVEGMDPARARDIPRIEDLTVVDPEAAFQLVGGEHQDMTLRVIDLVTPIGMGQRALIVAPPRTGKTVILQKLANAITTFHPEVKLLVCLVDERPEEATDMKRAVKGEVYASTNDLPAVNHVAMTELVTARAKRLCEMGHNVVVLVDSLTRLGRAYNIEARGSGRTLTGGLDAKVLEKPKAHFGAARNIEHGGSLTVIATALIDTGSRMDQVIFEEFKGTGNMELVLDREAADRRIWPAIDVTSSGTRKEEKLVVEAKLKRMHALRRLLAKMKPIEGLETLIDRLNKTRSNEEFLALFDPK